MKNIHSLQRRVIQTFLFVKIPFLTIFIILLTSSQQALATDLKTYTWYLTQSDQANGKTSIPIVATWDTTVARPDYFSKATTVLNTTGTYEWDDPSNHSSNDVRRTLLWRGRGTVATMPSNYSDYELINFKHWKYIDKFIFFGGSQGEGNIIAPDPWIINQAHAAGVKVYGTVFIPPNAYGGYYAQVEELTKNSNAVQKKLAEIGLSLKLDGWLINLEANSSGQTLIDRDTVNKLIAFRDGSDHPGQEFIYYAPDASSPWSGVSTISDATIKNMAAAYNYPTNNEPLANQLTPSNGALKETSSTPNLMFLDEPLWNTLRDGLYVDSAKCDVAYNSINLMFQGLKVNEITWKGIRYYTKKRILATEPPTPPTCRYINTTSMVNIAPYANLSSPLPGPSNIERIVDGVFDTNVHSEIYAPYVQFDLKSSLTIGKIGLWHYWGDGRIYNSVVVRASNDPTFTTGVVTLYSNDNSNYFGFGAGLDRTYSEGAAGFWIQNSADINGNTKAIANARYLRFYSHGSNKNTGNHLVEVEIYAHKYDLLFFGRLNVARGKPVATANNGGGAPTHTEYITDGDISRTKVAYLGDGNASTKIDLGKRYLLTGMNVRRGALSNSAKDVSDYVGTSPFPSNATKVFGPESRLEEPTGNTILFPSPVPGRYIFDYSNGTVRNNQNYITEIEVYLPTMTTKKNLVAGLAPSWTSFSSANNLAAITDGVFDSNLYADLGSGNACIVFDLGSTKRVSEVWIWHYYLDNRQYKNVSVATAATYTSGSTGNFIEVFNNTLGDGGYTENEFGKGIVFPERDARAVKLCSNGSSTNPNNHYVEVQVLGN